MVPCSQGRDRDVMASRIEYDEVKRHFTKNLAPQDALYAMRLVIDGWED